MPSTAGGPVVQEDGGVTFTLADPHGRLSAVRLVHELARALPLDFARERGRWWLRIPPPPVDRMEYLFEIEDHNGDRATITDPANPARVPGAFGDKSELRLAGYREPAWLGRPAVAATVTPFVVPAPLLDDDVTGELWSPAGLGVNVAAPLLVVHDGPEYARLGAFTQYVGALVAAGALPAVRVALFAPGDRNVWYAAHADYADTLANAVLPRLRQQAPATAHVGVGVSLGALALLHLHRRHSALFDGLFLQSGSFFTPDLDPQERDFAGFAGVTGFVAGVSKGDPLRPVPTVVTCGEPEENYANNRRMVTALDALGFAATFVPRRDAHNYTAWRDALDPYLTDLVHASVVTRAA